MQNRLGLQNSHQERARLQELVEGAFEDVKEIRAAQKFYALPDPAPPAKQRVIESPKWEM